MAATPLGVWVRFIIAASAAVYSNWDSISGLFDRQEEAPDKPILGYYLQNIFEMKDASGGFTSRDRGMFGVHYINTTGGDLDTTWIAADFAAVEAAVAAFWPTVGMGTSSDTRLIEHRWYPYGPGVVPPMPAHRVTVLGSPILGNGTINAPHQLATTVTLRTALRRHWGRFYLPLWVPSWGTGGQLFNTQVDNIATAARTMLTAPVTSQGIVPVVYDRQRHSVLGVTQLEADSVPDIIRRRRPRTTTYRKIFTA